MHRKKSCFDFDRKIQRKGFFGIVCSLGAQYKWGCDLKGLENIVLLGNLNFKKGLRKYTEWHPNKPGLL